MTMLRLLTNNSLVPLLTIARFPRLHLRRDRLLNPPLQTSLTCRHLAPALLWVLRHLMRWRPLKRRHLVSPRCAIYKLEYHLPQALSCHLLSLLRDMESTVMLMLLSHRTAWRRLSQALPQVGGVPTRKRHKLLQRQRSYLQKITLHKLTRMGSSP